MGTRKSAMQKLVRWGLMAGLLAGSWTQMGGCGDSGDTINYGSTTTTTATAQTDTSLNLGEDLPGLVLTINSATGGSGSGGNFQAGDYITINYTIKKTDGSRLPLNEVDGTGIWMAGPTSNYQHILPSGNTTSYSDMKTASVEQSDGSYNYTFSAVIPSTYGAPLYNTTRFSDGELTGTALESGTYTVAMRMYKNYTEVTGTTYRDAGWATKDFLYGSATSIDSREVVKDTNCNQCHVQIQFHGGGYRSVKLCVTCHTSGAEDRNSVAGSSDATPVTIDFRVMIHKIHNGAHLPSVLGVATTSTGARDYSATATPYKVGGSTAYDFSEIAFPAWPNLNYGMPRDVDYNTGSGSSTTTRSLEDEMLRGVTNCGKCHGDPDGSGSATAPSQGTLAYTQLTRRACGSCHDDINWDYPYTANGETMAAQANDSSCADCHVDDTNSSYSVQKDPEYAHVHPFFRTSATGTMTFTNPGVNVVISAVAEPTGDSNGDDDGVVEAGEKVAMTFTVKNDAGTALTLSSDSTASMTGVLSGPTDNYNLLLYTTVPRGVITGASSYTINVPQPVFLDYVGDSTASATDAFTVSRGPIWTYTTTHPVYVHVRTATGSGSTLTSASVAYQNYLDVSDGAGSVFARGDFVVVDDGAAGEEYLKVQRVQADYSGTTDRLWFASPYQLSSVGTSAFSSTLNSSTFGPWLRNAHSSGAGISKVTLTLQTVTTNYTYSGSTVTEVSDSFGTGQAVIVSYTGDFQVPSVYPTALNSSTDITDAWGKWQGKSLVEGTYTATFWASKSLYITPAGASTSTAPAGSNDNTSYNTPASGAKKDFLIGDDETVVTAYSMISSGTNCESCHVQLMFHGGGRRGFNACISCHGTAGAEDWPWYRASSSGTFPAVDTTGTTVNFRTMLHSIHMGSSLYDADTYTVLGNSASEHTYELVVFPAWPGEAKHCDKCHGSSNSAWYEPSDRRHPSQTNPLRRYEPVCLSCHDGADVDAHYDLNVSTNGYEACAACHDANSVYSPRVVHKNR